MKKIILILILGFFTSLNTINAATCTEAWQVTQTEITSNYYAEIGSCFDGDAECFFAAEYTFWAASIVNDNLWIACCVLTLGWNC